MEDNSLAHVLDHIFGTYAVKTPKAKRVKHKPTVEYLVREIDIHGDSIDPAHYATEAEAMAAAKKWVHKETVAVVVDKVTDELDYDQLHVAGDQNALAAGGWVTT
jgi:hypothetical protein